MAARRAILLDTDIGTDVDDLVALALALCSPELELVGVTTVYGDVALRARMVAKMLLLAGREAVPVACGAREPLLGRPPMYWSGHEGEGLLEPDETLPPPATEHAVDLIVRTVMARPGEITLVTIGPLTNAALAFGREPRLAQALRELVVMGGVARLDPQALGWPLAEHNVRSDPEAARIVFQAGVPLVMVGLDVTLRSMITRSDAESIAEGGAAFQRAVADQLVRYMELNRREYTYMHDPLAVSLTVDPTFVTTEQALVQIETAGEFARGMTLVSRPVDGRPNAEVAMTVVAPRFIEFLLQRLRQGPVRGEVEH